MEYLLDYNLATHTRTGTASNVDPRNGHDFQETTEAANWLSTDTPCIMNSDGAVRAEGARTNTDTQSRDFSTWTGSNATVTTDQTDGPDFSSNEADLVEASSATSPKITKATGVSSGAVSVSVWVKQATWSGNVTLALSGGSTNNTTVALSSEWQRVTVNDASVSGATTMEIQLDADADADLYVWGAQVEAAPFHSSDIRTAGAGASRALDDMTFSGGSWDSRIHDGTWSVTVTPQYASTEPANSSFFYIFQCGGAGILYFFKTGSNLQCRLAVTTSVVDQTITFDAHQAITITVDWPNSQLTISGATTGDGTYAMTGSPTDWGEDPATDTLYVGISSSNTRAFFGLIGRPVAA